MGGFGAKPTQRACAQDHPRDWKDEGRKFPEISRHRRKEEVSQQKGAAVTSRYERSSKRRTQSAEGCSRDQSTEPDSQEMRVGQRGG